MAWIATVSDEAARGSLAQFYDAVRKRAGRVRNVVRAMSPNPPVLRASMELYQTIMLRESSISRSHRELLAAVVSKINNCHY